MRKLKSLALLAFVALAVTACSGSKQDVEQAPEQELYSTGQTYLQKGDYSQAIRYLTAVDNRFPGSSYSEQVQLNLIYAYYKSQDYTETLVTVDRFIKARLARHELAIAKFYFTRDAYVATAKRVVSMLKLYPDTQATLEALPLMKESYERMNLKQLADQTAKIIAANEGKKFAEPEKPKAPELKAPQK